MQRGAEPSLLLPFFGTIDKSRFWLEKPKFVLHNDIRLIKENPVTIDDSTGTFFVKITSLQITKTTVVSWTQICRWLFRLIREPWEMEHELYCGCLRYAERDASADLPSDFKASFGSSWKCFFNRWSTKICRQLREGKTFSPSYRSRIYSGKCNSTTSWFLQRSNMEEELNRIGSQFYWNRFKFGVLLLKDGQTSETEMYSNGMPQQLWITIDNQMGWHLTSRNSWKSSQWKYHSSLFRGLQVP